MPQAKSSAAMVMPFIGLSEMDCAGMVQWSNKLLCGNTKGGARKRRGLLNLSRAVSAMSGGAASPASAGSPVASFRTLRSLASTVRTAGKAADVGDGTMSPMSGVGTDTHEASDDTSDGQNATHSPAQLLTEQRLLHMQQVQAKLDRAREAHSRAEYNRRALHYAIQQHQRDVKLPQTDDLRKLDKRNCSHPLAESRLDASMRAQARREHRHQVYLRNALFSGL